MAKKNAKLHLWHIIGIVAIAAAALAALGTEPPSPPVILQASFESLQAACLSGERGAIEVRAAGSSIIITAPIQTPTPCYDVSGEAAMEGRSIRVVFRTAAKPGICVQCLGLVTGRATLSGIAPGSYEVEVTTPGGTERTTVTLPP